MISAIRLENFKAFEQEDIPLAPITVILGPNNSGKSSILAVLRILVQTIESFDPQIPILLNGMMGDFGTFSDVVYSGHGRRRRYFKIGLQVMSNPRTPYTQDNTSSDSLMYWKKLLDGKQIDVSLKFRYRDKRHEIILQETVLNTDGNPLISTKYSEDTERQLIESLGIKQVPSGLKSELSKTLRYQNFLPRYIIGFIGRDKGTALYKFLGEDEQRADINELRDASRIIESELRNIEYVAAMRTPASRTYSFSGERRQHVGAAGEYAASVLAMDSLRGGQRSLKISSNIRDWMAKAGIASDIAIKQVSDRYYEIRVQHPITGEYQNLTDVGQGNSQVLPVLVAGYNLRSGSCYIVEEPEIHLHPRAQAELGDFFLDLYQRGVQSIIETHSESVVFRLQQHIASGNIPPEHIKFYYVYAPQVKEPDKVKKRIKMMHVDEDGYFIDEWPEGFFSEPLEETEKLSMIRYKKHQNPS